MRIVTRKTLNTRRANDSLKRTTRKPTRKPVGKAKLVARPTRKADAKTSRRKPSLSRHAFRNDSIRTSRIDSLKRASFKSTRNARNCALKKDSEDEEVTKFVKELIKAEITTKDIIKVVKEFKSTEEEPEEDLDEEELDEELETSDNEGEVKDLTPTMGDSLKSIGALAKKTNTNDSTSIKEDDAWTKRYGGK